MSRPVIGLSCYLEPAQWGAWQLPAALIPQWYLDLFRSAGADVVIISNVYRPHVARETEVSLARRGVAAVGRQALNIILSEKEKRGIDLVHRLYPHVTLLNVSADLGNFSFLNRRESRPLLARGYREALKVLAAAKQRGTFDVRSNVKNVGTA